MVRTRIYRKGVLDGTDFPLDQLAERLSGGDTIAWVDLSPSDTDQLAVLAGELGLHAIAVRDATQPRPRPNFVRYEDHAFLTGQAVRLEPKSGRLTASPVAAFITATTLVTVRAGDTVDLAELGRHCRAEAALGVHEVGMLLHGLLCYLVHEEYEAARALDDALADLEDALFDGRPDDAYVQRRSHQLRRSLVMLRRLALPTRDVLDAVTGEPEHLIGPKLRPYFRSLYDQAVRAVELTDSMREVVATIMDTRNALRDNRLNAISKKVTGWAALIAIPAVVTGFYGMNVPFPGDGKVWGFWTSIGIMAVLFAALFALFKRKDWL